MRLTLFTIFVFFTLNAGSQNFEPARDLIDTETSREGLIYLGVEFRYYNTYTQDFSFSPPNVEGRTTSSHQQAGFGFGGHLEYFFDRKENIPFSVVFSAMYNSADIIGTDLPMPEIQSDLITAQIISTELSAAYFILGSDVSVTAGIGTGFSLGLTSVDEDFDEILDALDNGVSIYIPLSIRYNYQIFSIDGFIGFFYNPYITPITENTDSQSAYGLTLSVRNPFKVYY
jgi:hypothetical protein